MNQNGFTAQKNIIYNSGLEWVRKVGYGMEQKVKQDIPIGKNIRDIRKSKQLGQTELVHLLQLHGCDLTRESLVKIERGIQHIKASQLIAIKEVLDTSFEDLLLPSVTDKQNQ